MFCGVPRIDHDVFGSYVCPADCIQREGMLDRFSTPRIGWEHHLLEWSSFHENRTLIPKDNPPKWFLLRFMAATSIPCCSSELMELISAMVWPQHLNPREDVGFIIQIIQDIDWHWWSSCLGVTRYWGGNHLQRPWVVHATLLMNQVCKSCLTQSYCLVSSHSVASCHWSSWVISPVTDQLLSGMILQVGFPLSDYTGWTRKPCDALLRWGSLHFAHRRIRWARAESGGTLW